MRKIIAVPKKRKGNNIKDKTDLTGESLPPEVLCGTGAPPPPPEPPPPEPPLPEPPPPALNN